MTGDRPVRALTGARCVLCGGTGSLWLDRSWFTADGMCRSRCGVCGGTGFNSYRPEADYVRSQAERRSCAGRAALDGTEDGR